MRLICLQHEPHEGPGAIRSWCLTHGRELLECRVFAGEAFPETREDDALLVMGGGMGANDDGRHPWLAEEKRFIGRCIRAQMKVVGICLGAQLIAAACGAPVYRNRCKEIGWFPIDLTAAGAASPLFGSCPPSFPVFHWHGDSFDLPSGAVLLASSAAAERQAFSIGDRILGLQFHLEIDRELVERFVEGGKSELVKAEFVQTPEEIAARYELLPELNRRLFDMLDAFFDDRK
ncbi:MAG: type 1 glutamine amidotransferase [Spirochaetales bacterium]|nr:type 1 glutamine amidotransferase [Spirochaetales bacterium]